MSPPRPPVALITGGSRGIGAATALLLAPTHALALAGRDPDALHATVSSCIALGADTDGFSCDLSRADDLPSLIDAVVSRFGHLDVLIHSAGLWLEEPLDSADLDDWDAVLDVNLRSIIHLTHYALPYLRSSPFPAIIFLSSTAARTAYPNGSLYCATKFGLLGFSSALFEDVRDSGIKVCSISPSVVNTSMHDPSSEHLDPTKMIQPHDVALAIQFVLSSPPTVCPTEITLLPQRNPKLHRR